MGNREESKVSSADGVVGPRELGLFDPLLALLGVEVAGRA